MRGDWQQAMVSRRNVLKGAGAAALAGAATPLLAAAAQQQSQPAGNLRGTELKILQWVHFVPQYDKWFDPFVKAWGDANGVKTTVDHINTTDVPATFAAEIAAKKGHDLVEDIAPRANLEPSLVDLTDVVQEANKQFGPQSELSRQWGYNPTTNHFFSFVHGWAPDPGDYRKAMWEKVNLGDGPATYDELLSGGTKIYQDQGVHMGIGMSNEIDSNMAASAMVWSFGGAVQDAHENIVLNSPQTIAAVEYMVKLYKATMTPEVFGWNPASNNQLLIAGRASYILNSISAYRTAQTQQPQIAKDIYFTKALKGPGGVGLVNGHAIMGYMIPNYSKNIKTAKAFLLHLLANYSDACYQSQLYNLPGWPSTAPKLLQEGGWLDNDPFGSQPANKLAILKDADKWTVSVGYPGPTNAIMGDVLGTYVLPRMMGRAAQGQQSPKDSVAQATKECEQIAQKWRKAGLVGGSK